MATETHSASPVDASDGVPAAEAAHAASDHGVPAGTTEAAGHGEGGGGLPQFQFEYWGGQIVWLLILFAILYVLFARVFVPRFRAVAETRAQTIADALSEARRVQAEADAKAEAVKSDIDKARADARKLVADARAKASDEMAKTQAAQDAELSAQIDKAEVRIRGLRDQAMTNVGGIAAETASSIVAKLTGRPVTAAEAKAAEGVA
jgi:F-type H+-transporting ATPase subunit b